MFRIAEREYRRTLDARALLDFPDVLLKTIELLRQMEEFAQSRFRLESRYHHVLVDEFQDTSRAQWQLVSLLVEAWGEGAGLAHTGALPPRSSSSATASNRSTGFAMQTCRSFARPAIHGKSPAGWRCAPINLAKLVRCRRSCRSSTICLTRLPNSDRRDAFEYEEEDRFPVDESPEHHPEQVLGVVTGDSFESCARTTTEEIARLLREAVLVRDRDTGIRRPIRAGDVAILFRTREPSRLRAGVSSARHLGTSTKDWGSSSTPTKSRT